MILDESILIERLKKKDNAAFKEIVDACRAMVYNTVLGILQNTEDAEDVAQEVFLSMHRGLPYFRGEARLSTWIYRIVIKV